jgi:Ca-activated chloride channel family protein
MPPQEPHPEGFTMAHRIGRVAALLLAVAAGFSFTAQARAQHIVIERRRPTPPVTTPAGPVELEVRSLSVNATVRGRVARVELDQVFFNPSHSELEGTYLFPLPENAAVDGFSMWVDGTEMQGELLDADRARSIYEAIVRSRRDPALLEFMGTRLFRARIFPIPPQTEKRVRLRYTEMLKGDAGTVAWRFPLSRAAGGGTTPGRVSVLVDIETTRRLASVYSPTHALDVVRSGERAAKASWEGTDARSAQDFALLYQEPAGELGTSFSVHREPAEDGTFMLLLAPAVDADEKPIARDIVLCLDTSGSMAGPKIEQARAALRYAVRTLGTEDRFALVTFATESRRFRPALVPAGKDEVDAALAWIDNIQAVGGTAIEDALATSMSYLADAPAGDAARPAVVLFLTDGLPTIGERDPVVLVDRARKAAPARARLFSFGVGHDVNTVLIDRLAEDLRGARDYVVPGEDIEVKVSSLVAKTRHPVITDLTFEVEGVAVHEVHPRRLPDLFRGGEIVLLGRFTGEGSATLRIKGRTGGGVKEFVEEVRFPAREAGSPWIPRLWAVRRVGHLLDEIRLRGETAELKDEVVRLAKRHGILTPFTSWLVLEDERMLNDFGGRTGGRREEGAGGPPPPRAGARSDVGADADAELRERLRGIAGPDAPVPPDSAGSSSPNGAAPAPVSGAGAVDRSLEVKKLRDAEDTSAGESDALKDIVRHVDGRTFYLRHGVWCDSAVATDAKRTTLVRFSDAWMALAAKSREAARMLALGKVVFTFDAVVYEVIEEE